MVHEINFWYEKYEKFWKKYKEIKILNGRFKIKIWRRNETENCQ